MQIHPFSDLEGVRIAAEMERRGEEFYRRAAKVVKDRETVAFLEALAGDERVHIREFESLHQRLTQQMEEEQQEDVLYGQEVSAYLSAIAADVVFPGGLVALGKGLESPRAVLEGAIQSEKDSILFYGEMVQVAANERARAVFREIILTERSHLNKLQRMLGEHE